MFVDPNPVTSTACGLFSPNVRNMDMLMTTEMDIDALASRPVYLTTLTINRNADLQSVIYEDPNVSMNIFENTNNNTLTLAQIFQGNWPDVKNSVIKAGVPIIEYTFQLVCSDEVQLKFRVDTYSYPTTAGYDTEYLRNSHYFHNSEESKAFSIKIIPTCNTHTIHRVRDIHNTVDLINYDDSNVFPTSYIDQRDTDELFIGRFQVVLDEAINYPSYLPNDIDILVFKSVIIQPTFLKGYPTPLSDRMNPVHVAD